MSVAGRAIAAVAEQAQKRVPAADLDERDPDYIRETLPRLWMLASLYFRAEVRGLEQIPEEGPVLMVGNHSGRQPHARHAACSRSRSAPTSASSAASTSSRTTSCCRCRGSACCASTARSRPRRRTPSERSPRAPPCSSTRAATTRCTGPSWESAKVDFGGRKGFVRLAKRRGVPIVPVVAVGGQETALFLSRGEGLARMLGLDRMFRLKVLPISLALPWVVNVGDMLGHIPLPAKITIQVLPSDRRRRHGRRRRLRRDHRPHAAHPQRAAGRATPAGPGMRLEKHELIDASRDEVWELISDPVPVPALHGRHDARQAQGAPSPSGAWARATRCTCSVGSAEVGGLVEIVEFDEPGGPRLDERHRHRPAAALAAARGRRRAYAGHAAAGLRRPGRGARRAVGADLEADGGAQPRAQSSESQG